MATGKSLKSVIRTAVEYAIKEVGVDTLKRTSMFMSNDRVEADIKRAA